LPGVRSRPLRTVSFGSGAGALDDAVSRLGAATGRFRLSRTGPSS
jgi:hypothetical protein